MNPYSERKNTVAENLIRRGKWIGKIDRGQYLLIGVIGFAIKHNLDRLVAWLGFHRQWSVFNYWIPLNRAVRINSLQHADAVFLLTMLALSLPFIIVGVVLTLGRLRSAGLPHWLVLAFFLPYANLAFFLLLSVLPAKPEGNGVAEPSSRGSALLGRVVPESTGGSAAMAVGLTALFGIGGTVLSVEVFSRYGWGLFVALPFCLGLFAVLIYGYHRSRGFWSCIGVACLSVGFVALGLLALAFEGLFCIVMAAPIALPLAIMGATVGYYLQKRAWLRSGVPASLLIVFLFVPLLMGAESRGPQEPLLNQVSTKLVINAPPEIVWQGLIAFPKLPQPHEWPFRLGVAYPIAATVVGQGVAAQRECQFSAGQFVEPVEAWQVARRLKFRITSEPLLMKEWTPYHEIHPKHLEGHFFQPVEAEFVLTPLPNGRTLLEGRSWYRNKMWPAAYWRLWSDAIVHNIHVRVFEHIKELAEARAAQSQR
jgi:hypothetical protein